MRLSTAYVSKNRFMPIIVRKNVHSFLETTEKDRFSRALSVDVALF